MPGTLVKDTLAPKLIDAENITASANGTIVDVNYPFECQAEAVVASTVSGTNPTLDIEIQSSDVSDFSSGVVSHGRFKQLVAADASSAVTHRLPVRIYKRYVRAVKTIGGTSTPTFNGVSVILRARNYQRTNATQTA